MPDDQLETAVAGDKVARSDLQSAARVLKDMANGMEDLKTNQVLKFEDLQAIGRAQADLRTSAGKLVADDIDLLAGEAKITATHIQSAVDYANAAGEQVADFKKRLQQAGAVVTFIAVVLTGNGAAIVSAAGTLKSALS